MNWLQDAITTVGNNIRIKKKDTKNYIFDPIRKKWILLQREEKIRQLLIQYLLSVYKVNPEKMGVEKTFLVDHQKKRFDLVVLNEAFEIKFLFELKNENENIFSNKNKFQILNYQRVLKADGFAITNGKETLGLKKGFSASWEMVYNLEEILSS